jgi:L-asparagine transporter-like permease
VLGDIAVLAIGVVGYFITVFPAAAKIPPAMLAVSFMWIFVGVNLFGVKTGGRVQVVTSLLKLVPLVLVLVVGAVSIISSPRPIRRTCRLRRSRRSVHGRSGRSRSTPCSASSPRPLPQAA